MSDHGNFSPLAVLLALACFALGVFALDDVGQIAGAGYDEAIGPQGAMVLVSVNAGGQAVADVSAQRERQIAAFSAMVFPTVAGLPESDRRRRLRKWEGHQIIRVLASERFADGGYRNVVPGGEHYDGLKNAVDQFAVVVPGVNFVIAEEGGTDIVMLFSEENIYEMMARKEYIGLINYITGAETKEDARANMSAVLQNKAAKNNCVLFFGANANGGIMKLVAFFQKNPADVLHPELDEAAKKEWRQIDLWGNCAMKSVLTAMGVWGASPDEIPSVTNSALANTLTETDKFVIRALYSGRVETGMTKSEAIARLFPAR